MGKIAAFKLSLLSSMTSILGRIGNLGGKHRRLSCLTVEPPLICRSLSKSSDDMFLESLCCSTRKINQIRFGMCHSS